MRIGSMDFELGHLGRIHQAVLDAIPKEGEAVDYGEISKLYEGQRTRSDPGFDEVLKNLEPWLESKRIGGSIYYRQKVWLSTSEVARVLGVSVRTVQAWHQKGILPATRLERGHLRFTLAQVEEWLSQDGSSVIQGDDDPVLTELWNNEADAAYDRL